MRLAYIVLLWLYIEFGESLSTEIQYVVYCANGRCKTWAEIVSDLKIIVKGVSLKSIVEKKILAA